MHAGTSPSAVTQTTEYATRTSRRLLFTVALAAALLAGCASRVNHAPVTDLTGETSIAAPSSDTYVVVSGDTLYKIAQSHNMDVGTLERINNISNPNQLRVGQTLRLSGTATAASPAPVAAPVAVVPTTPVKPKEPETPPPASDAGVIRWGWPAKGRIIQSFNANTKGIDIEGTEGEPINAAADGKVMYAGNGVRGLGNLVLLGHSDGFITAYAHAHELLVKTGQKVKKGAKIATIGKTETTSPRLHFEIRRHGTAVDPLAYLPTR